MKSVAILLAVVVAGVLLGGYAVVKLLGLGPK